MKKRIFDKIKAICKEKGIAVSELERQAGLAKGNVYKWNESSPTVDNIQAVASVLKVSVDKLIN